MNYKLENRISMYYKVREFFSNHLAILAAIVPALTAQVGIFNTELTTLDGLMIIADEPTSGHATQKQNVRNMLRDQALAIAGSTYAFAKLNNNAILAGNVVANKSSLNGKRDTDFLYWVDRLNALSNANAAALAPMGVTAGMLTTFLNTINEYRLLIQEPADKRSEGKAALIESENQVAKIDEKLNIIDALMYATQATQSMLFHQYQADRLIDDNTSGSGTPADVTEIIEAGNSENIYQVGYSSGRSFKLVNQGDIALEWGLSDDENNPTHPLHPIDPQSTSQKMSSTLAPSGDFIIVRNTSTENATVELTIVEE